MGHHGTRWVVTTLTLLAVLWLSGSAAAQTLEEVVAGLEGTYGRITDLKADFTQVSNNKSLGQDIKAEGTVLLKKGGKMRWDYKSPSPQQIVSDGSSLWVYTPELNQVNKGDAPKALAGPAGSFLAGLGRVREEFTVRFLNPAAKVDGAGRHAARPHPQESDSVPHAPGPRGRPQGLHRPPGRALRPARQCRDHELHPRGHEHRAGRHPVRFHSAQGRGGGAAQPAVVGRVPRRADHGRC